MRVVPHPGEPIRLGLWCPRDVMWVKLLGVLGTIGRGVWKWILVVVAVAVPAVGWWIERKRRLGAEARAATAVAIVGIEARRRAAVAKTEVVWQQRYTELHQAALRDGAAARNAAAIVDRHAGGDVDDVAADINEALGLEP